MNRNIVLSLVIASLGALTALWIATPPALREKAVNLVRGGDRTVFVLFDLSGSTKSMRETYARGFEKILVALQAGDRIIVDRIIDNPLAQSTFPVNEGFTKYGVFDRRGNPIYEPVNRKELDEKKKSVQEGVDKVLASFQYFHSTPILDALQLAERVFSTYPEGRPVLVIFSDMVEVSGEHNFSVEELTPQRIKSIIEEERMAGELPDLKGVRVYVIGAGAGEESSLISSGRWFNIQNFWLAYFAATGANLPKDRYGAALLKF